MATLKCGTHSSLKSNVATKFSTGSSTMIYILLMIALLLELVEPPVIIAPTVSLCGSNWSAKISWRLAESIGSSDHLPILTKLNHKICYQLLSQELLDGIETTLTGSALQTKSKSRKWTIFLMNITYLFKSLVSLTFSSQLKQLTLEDLNPARNVNLGWLHTCKPKSTLEIASVGQYIKIDRRGSMLAVKPRRLSTRPRQKVGKTFFKTECRIQMAQMCGKSFKV